MHKPDLDILKSPEAQKMLPMVTADFYNRSYYMLWIFEVIGREWDDMADWAQEVRREAFPQTCTWSIGIWEGVYGIPIDDTLPLDYRRQRLLAKKLQRPPINPARIESVLIALTGCPVAITEDVAPYTFQVEIDESNASPPVDYDQVKETLDETKPSHLSVRYTAKVKAEFTAGQWTGAGTAEHFTDYFIGDETAIQTDGASVHAAAAGDQLREYMMDETPDEQTQQRLQAAAEFTLLYEVFTEPGDDDHDNGHVEVDGTVYYGYVFSDNEVRPMTLVYDEPPDGTTPGLVKPEGEAARSGYITVDGVEYPLVLICEDPSLPAEIGYLTVKGVVRTGILDTGDRESTMMLVRQPDTDTVS